MAVQCITLVFVFALCVHGSPDSFEDLSSQLINNLSAAPFGRFDVGLPPLVKSKLNREEFFEFLGSSAFADAYWERCPLLLRTDNAFASVLDLNSDVMSTSFVVRGNKKVPPFRNVRFVPSSFYKEEDAARDLGFADGSVVGEQELRAAMAKKHTLQMYGAQAWWPRVAELCMNLSLATSLPTNVNVYITPAGLETSLPAHNDFTCNFMVQLHGRKRWRLWKRPEFWLPTSQKSGVTHLPVLTACRQIYGRDESEPLSDAALGPPLLDVVLAPGDVLYVPRGCFHSTSTAGLAGEPSLHLTPQTQAAVMYDDGPIFTWAALLAELPALGSTLAALAPSQPGLREGLPRALLAGAPLPAWREHAAQLLHAALDAALAGDLGQALDRAVVSRRNAVSDFRAKLSKLQSAVPEVTRPRPASKSSPSGFQDLPQPSLRPPARASISLDPLPVPAIVPAAASKPSLKQVKSFVPSPEAPATPAALSDSTTAGHALDAAELPIPSFDFLFDPPAPSVLSARCLYESEAGACGQLGSRNAQAVVLKVYGRLPLLGLSLEELCRQTVPVDLFVWNNNHSSAAVAAVDAALRGLTCSAVRTGWVHHSPANILQGEYVLAAAIHARYPSIVFLDDDAPTGPEVVGLLAAEAQRFANTVLSAWALDFSTFESYWDRTMPAVHGLARYCGSAQMVVPAALFANTTALLRMFPARFRSVSDLWLNAYAVLAHGASLRRSAAPVHSSRAGDDYDRGQALSQQPGMRALKTEFLQHLSREHLWPFVGDPGSESVALAAAQASAERGALGRALAAHRLCVRNWPSSSRAWNNLGVVLLRLADTLATGPAAPAIRSALLGEAREALDTARKLAPEATAPAANTRLLAKLQ